MIHVVLHTRLQERALRVLDSDCLTDGMPAVQRYQTPVYGFPAGKAGPVPVAQEPAYHQAHPTPTYAYQQKTDFASQYGQQQQQQQQERAYTQPPSKPERVFID